jgi:PAS domain S-box-containing protein
MQQQAIQSLLILGGIVILTYLGLSRLLLQPLNRLHKVAESYGQGDLSARTEINSRDEIGSLAGTLNDMAGLLEEMINESRRKEEQLQDKNEELTAIEEELRHQLDEIFEVQHRLQSSEENYRCLVEHANSIILRLNRAGEITFFNEYAEKLFGFSREEIVGKKAVGMIVPETESGGRDLVTLIQSIIQRPDDFQLVENENIGKNGEKLWIRWANRPYFDEMNAVTEILCVGQNITEHRLLEHQILQQQKLEGIGLLAGGIAHDFNNLLSPIFIYAEMVRKKLDPADQSYARLGTILEAAGKAKDLVKQLLSFSSKQMLTSLLHDLNDITTDFATMLRRTIRENIQLNVQLCSEPCPIMADKTQIEQILLNLAVNAQDAIHGNGSITIETGHLTLDNEYCAIHLGAIPGRYIMLSFSDTGCGMDDATLNHVFEPFFTTKAVGHGTGLGLSTVYGIVKQHGGHISIQSKSDIGTTFLIYLPESMLEVVRSMEMVNSECKHIIFSGTILLVEDNEMVRELTEDLLKSHNFKVVSAECPEAALELFEKHKDDIQLLLTDIVMPQMNGPELYERLVVQSPALKVLFMSGYANNISVHNGSLEEGANFISKPFTSETLVKRVYEITAPGSA